MCMLIVSSLIQEIAESQKTRRAGEFFSTVCKYRFDTKKLELPDHVFDKHTTRGKKMGRGLTHFFEEAGKLIPLAEEHTKYKKSGEESWLYFESIKKSGLKESRRELDLFDS